MATFYSCVGRCFLGAAFVLAAISIVHSAAPETRSGADDGKVEDLVREALQHELAGKNENRENLIWEAFRRSPENSAVRWQLGQVRGEEDGLWRTPLEVELASRNDERLANYRKLRDAASSTLEDQLQLARWCRKNKLGEEERVHWLAVLRLQPDNSEAIERLDLHSYQGAMLTSGQIEKLKSQSRKLDKIARRWQPVVAQWRRNYRSGEPFPSAEMKGRIAKISDSAEMQALERTIRQEEGGRAQYHAMALALAKSLEENPYPAAAECLVNLAASSPWDDVHDASIAGLKRHSFDHYVPPLLNGLRTLVVGNVRQGVGRGGDPVTSYSVYRDNAVENRVYSTRKNATARNAAPQFVMPVAFDLSNAGQARPMANLLADIRFSPEDNAENVFEQFRQTQRMRTEQREAVMCNAVANGYRGMALSNARIVGTLRETTEQNLGDEPSKWWNWWWQDYNETVEAANRTDTPSLLDANLFVVAPYAVEASSQPEYRSEVTQRYQVYVPNSYPTWPTSCFAPGTKVWTQLGRVEIGKIKVGDRVLAQDVDSGELAYKPVLAVTVRKPGPRIKIGFESETIVATPSHPFWIDGQGWRLTKQLEIGNALHSVSGCFPVESIEEVETDPTKNGYSYNLIVADFSTYFVGDHGILVHDNTPRQPTSSLVPGLPAEISASSVRE